MIYTYIRILSLSACVSSYVVTGGADAIRAQRYGFSRWRWWRGRPDIGASHPRCLPSDERSAFASLHKQQQLWRQQHALSKVWNVHSTWNTSLHSHTHKSLVFFASSTYSAVKAFLATASTTSPCSHSQKCLRCAATPLLYEILSFVFALCTYLHSSSPQSAQYSSEAVPWLPSGSGGSVSVGERRTSSANHKHGTQFVLWPVSIHRATPQSGAESSLFQPLWLADSPLVLFLETAMVWL